jgi:putative phosphoribosyl transferase
MIFKDRKDAGRQLAEKLGRYRDNPDAIVLGLPRGGVVVAREIAGALHCKLDILIVRKIGFPGNPEFAAGAVSEIGSVVLNEGVVSEFGVSKGYLDRETVLQKEEIARRAALYRGRKGIPSLTGKTVILVDDGAATGATMKAAILTLKQEPIDRLVAALPVASLEAEEEIASMVDECICLLVPDVFGAVSRFYRDFAQVEDEEVAAMLK